MKIKQVPQGYIRCDYFIVTHYDVIWLLFTLINGHIRCSKITRDRRTYGPTDGPTDLRTDGRTDTTSYRDATTHLKSSQRKWFTESDVGGAVAESVKESERSAAPPVIDVSDVHESVVRRQSTLTLPMKYIHLREKPMLTKPGCFQTSNHSLSHQLGSESVSGAAQYFRPDSWLFWTTVRGTMWWCLRGKMSVNPSSQSLSL